MLVFKPRLALVYLIAFVIVSVVTKKLSISTQSAYAEAQTKIEKIERISAPVCGAK